ncbi:MAG: hypothetical protein ABEK59_04555 [Halobacteria archaeon]
MNPEGQVTILSITEYVSLNPLTVVTSGLMVLAVIIVLFYLRSTLGGLNTGSTSIQMDAGSFSSVDGVTDLNDEDGNSGKVEPTDGDQSTGTDENQATDSNGDQATGSDGDGGWYYWLVPGAVLIVFSLVFSLDVGPVGIPGERIWETAVSEKYSLLKYVLTVYLAMGILSLILRNHSRKFGLRKQPEERYVEKNEIVGEELDREIMVLCGENGVDLADTPVLDRLRETVVKILVAEYGVPDSSAERMVKEGNWTVDERAEAVLAGESYVPPFPERVREFFTDKTKKELDIEVVVSEIRTLRDVGSTGIPNLQDDGDSDGSKIPDRKEVHDTIRRYQGQEVTDENGGYR